MNVMGVREKGPCLFCTGKGSKERDLFIVKSPLFSGEVCGKHLFILVAQQPKPQEQPAPKH